MRMQKLSFESLMPSGSHCYITFFFAFDEESIWARPFIPGKYFLGWFSIGENDQNQALETYSKAAKM